MAACATSAGFECEMQYRDTLNPFRRRSITVYFVRRAPVLREFDDVLEDVEAEVARLRATVQLRAGGARSGGGGGGAQGLVANVEVLGQAVSGFQE